jgi:hypothetical protein
MSFFCKVFFCHFYNQHGERCQQDSQQEASGRFQSIVFCYFCHKRLGCGQGGDKNHQRQQESEQGPAGHRWPLCIAQMLIYLLTVVSLFTALTEFLLRHGFATKSR